MSEIDHLKKIYSRKTLDKLSKNHKLAYKYCLCAISITMFAGGNRTRGQEQNFIIIDQISKASRKKTNFDPIVRDLSEKVEESLKQNNFKQPYNQKFLNELIKFTRDKLALLENNGRSLFKVSEISSILDIKSFFNIQSASNHHWVDLDLHSGLILTVPEMIIFQDFKVNWNEYVTLRNILHTEKMKLSSQEEYFNYHNLKSTREKLYKFGSLSRVLVFLAVSFVEAYLYNLFYTIKEIDISGKEDINSILSLKKVEDEEIVKKVIFKLYPEVKNSTDNLFKKYKSVVKLRDRYVHASPFVDKSTNQSEILPLLNISEDCLRNSLQDCIDFIWTIENSIPDEVKLLFWWYDKEYDFVNLKPLLITNDDSRYERMNYYNT